MMNTNSEIKELAAVLDSAFRDGVDAEGRALFRQLVLLLADGNPISPGQMASALGLSHEVATAALGRLPSLEWDEAGRVVGAGLTLRPTPHRFELDHRTLFTWCALDALIFPGLIGQTAQVESPCLSTGTPVRVTVTPESVEKVEPPDAVVSVIVPEASPDVRRAFCDYVNFFRSAEAAREWLAAHPGAIILPVAEAFRLGRLLARSLFGQEDDKSNERHKRSL